MIRSAVLSISRVSVLNSLAESSIRGQRIVHLGRAVRHSLFTGNSSSCIHCYSYVSVRSYAQRSKTSTGSVGENGDSPVKRSVARKKNAAAFESSPSPSPEKKAKETPPSNSGSNSKRRRIASSSSEDEAPKEKPR